MLQNKIHTTPLHPLRQRFNRIANQLTERSAVHLFLLASPLSGSTMLQQLIGTSRTVATFDVEGQRLPELIPILNVDDRWNPDLEVDWDLVKRIYNSYWQPLRPIRFDKSPPHLIRASQLEHSFRNAQFLILVRNPYAQIEGMISRGWKSDIKKAARSWVRQTQQQLKNIDALSRTLVIRYEDLTNDPNAVVTGLQQFLPKIGDLNINSEFVAHNVTGQAITGVQDLNPAKIERMTARQIRQANLILQHHHDLLERFDYEIIEPVVHAKQKRSASIAKLQEEKLKIKTARIAEKTAAILVERQTKERERAKRQAEKERAIELQEIKRKRNQVRRDERAGLITGLRAAKIEKRQQIVARREMKREQLGKKVAVRRAQVEKRARVRQERIDRREKRKLQIAQRRQRAIELRTAAQEKLRQKMLQRQIEQKPRKSSEQ